MPLSRALLVAFFAISTPLSSQVAPTRLPPRVAEEADVLQQNAGKLVTQESLVQRSVMPPLRFRPREGTALAQATSPRLRIREVHSEFSFGLLRDSPAKSLIEYRQVLAVDGRTLQTASTALNTLSQNIRAGDDRVRKRMLEDFARTGLVDIATDYALILLAFTAVGQKQMEISPTGQGFIGTDAAFVYGWQQNSGAAGVLEFHGAQSVHRALAGTLWLRASDGLPLRIASWTDYTDAGGRQIRDEATVDYILSEHGFLTPASVVHRHSVNSSVVTENLYRYEPFKLFSASSSIQFGEVPDIKK